VPLAHGTPLQAVGFLMVAQLFGDSFAVAAIITATSLRQSIVPLNVMGRVAATFQVGGGAPGIAGALLGRFSGRQDRGRETLFLSATGIVAGIMWGVFSPLWRLREMPVAPAAASG